MAHSMSIASTMLPPKRMSDASTMLLMKQEPSSPTVSTMTFQGEGCADHLCRKRECGECGDDRFKPLLEFEFLDSLDGDMLAKLRELGWTPEDGNPIDYFDEYGDSLLHSAARKGETQVIKKLLEMGTQANTCCQGDCCCTPLMVACRWCQPGCASLLLDHGADNKHVNSYGETALDQVIDKAMGTQHDKAKILSLLRDSRMPRCA
jgi:hypothetical protein